MKILNPAADNRSAAGFFLLFTFTAIILKLYISHVNIIYYLPEYQHPLAALYKTID